MQSNKNINYMNDLIVWLKDNWKSEYIKLFNSRDDVYGDNLLYYVLQIKPCSTFTNILINLMDIQKNYNVKIFTNKNNQDESFLFYDVCELDDKSIDMLLEIIPKYNTNNILFKKKNTTQTPQDKQNEYLSTLNNEYKKTCNKNKKQECIKKQNEYKSKSDNINKFISGLNNIKKQNEYKSKSDNINKSNITKRPQTAPQQQTIKNSSSTSQQQTIKNSSSTVSNNKKTTLINNWTK